MLLLANNALIIHEFATGYVLKDSTESWDDRMHILINISSCGTLIGQALTKTAFAVTLIRISNQWQQYVLWFCILSMNLYMVVKVIFQWAKVCDKDSYDVWYRLNFCIGWKFRDSFKEGGNGKYLGASETGTFTNRIISLQRHYGFRFCIFSVVDHTRPGDEEGREDWSIRYDELGNDVSIGDMGNVAEFGLTLRDRVAIVTAIRIGWKDNGNDRDKWYICESLRWSQPRVFNILTTISQQGATACRKFGESPPNIKCPSEH